MQDKIVHKWERIAKTIIFSAVLIMLSAGVSSAQPVDDTELKRIADGFRLQLQDHVLHRLTREIRVTSDPEMQRNVFGPALERGTIGKRA